MKRKDVQRLALELVDAIDAMRTEMAAQDAVVQWQAAVIAELKAEVAKHEKRAMRARGLAPTSKYEVTS